MLTGCCSAPSHEARQAEDGRQSCDRVVRSRNATGGWSGAWSVSSTKASR